MESPDSFFYDAYRRRPPRARLVLLAGLAAVLVALACALVWWRPPAAFPSGTYLTVPTGATLQIVTNGLVKREVIRSPFWFRIFVALLGGARGVKAGDYSLRAPQPLPTVAWRLTRGRFDQTPIKVLLREGTNNREMAAALAVALPHFNAAQFLRLAKEREGYLFPDTYFFLPSTDGEQVLKTLAENFARKIAPLQDEIRAFKRPFAQIITMASLLEEEARTADSRRNIAGILWKRLDRGMLLQVDSVFPYIFGTAAYDLTDGDLLVDSPYNTYLHKGLPPTPIANPGIDSIRAAISPIATPYFFYLSDRDGVMHYAVTHDEHLANRAKYLNP